MLNGLNKTTTVMIYLGTFLLSILSFFTTFRGMTILLDVPLAFIGSLGLQVALLGVAWNLMKVRDKRLNYLIVFSSAAVFSIFFSFANFDSALKSPNRSQEARIKYTTDARPVLAEYQTITKQAARTAEYQLQRIDKLVEIEQDKGWATAVDEGSQDRLLQSVIDGARRAIISWEQSSGKEFRQGKGRGPVVNYLESHQTQIKNNLNNINKYSIALDSLAFALNGDLPVVKQHEIVNRAWSSFPSGAIALITAENPQLSEPPNRAEYAEFAQSRQQAFMMVINDFFEMDRLALFSILLAIVIDLIIILMALAGSHHMNEEDYLFDRLRQNATRRIRKLKFREKEEITTTINDNLDRLRKAGGYGVDLIRTINDYKNEKKRVKIKLKRGGESLPEEPEKTESNRILNMKFGDPRPNQPTSDNSESRTMFSKKTEYSKTDRALD